MIGITNLVATGDNAAASNRPDIVDPALLRPGRFDRILYVAPPELDSRLQIIKIYSQKMPVKEDVNLSHLAEITEGYTGADIASVTAAAVMLALREHIFKYEDPVEAEEHSRELKVGMRHFEEAMKKIRPLSSQELSWYKRIAEQFGKPRLRAATEAMRGFGGGVL